MDGNIKCGNQLCDTAKGHYQKSDNENDYLIVYKVYGVQTFDLCMMLVVVTMVCHSWYSETLDRIYVWNHP